MLFLSYTQSFRRLDHYIKTYNEQTDGLARQVRQSVTATAKELIRIYGASLTKAHGVSPIDPENLPSLRTNNVQLATLCNSSSRTAQRHIHKLMTAGVITHKVWHGSNSSYELWINPEVLSIPLKQQLISEKKAPEATKGNIGEILKKAGFLTENEGFEKKENTNCLHTDAGNTGNTNNIIIAVDNSEKLPHESLSHDRTDLSGDILKRCEHALTGLSDFSGNTGNTRWAETTDTSPKKKEEAGQTDAKGAHEADAGNIAGNIFAGNTEERGLVAIENTEGRGRDRAAEQDLLARTVTLDFYVKMLWTLAKNVLYKNIYLTEGQEKKGKELLRKWYEPVEDRRLSRVHEIYVERISLARKFVQKDPKRRFIQLPDRYFNPANPSGFAGTKPWWKAQEKRKKETQVKLILHAQIRRYLNNEKKPVHLRKPSLELFRSCEQRIGKLGDPILLEQFHAAILSPESHSSLYPNEKQLQS